MEQKNVLLGTPDTEFLEFAPPKSKRDRKKRPARKVKGDWTDEKVRKLISIVEQRPELWNRRNIDSSDNYRLPKPQVWRNVAAEIDDDEDGNECRNKWQHLRCTYNKILASSHKTNRCKVRWRFFNAMRFIEISDSANTTESSSIFLLDDDTASTSRSQSGKHLPSTSAAAVRIKQRRRKPSTATVVSVAEMPQPTIGTSKSKSFKAIAHEALQKLSHSDVHAAFGDHIAAELRSLPENDALVLKCRLTRAMLDFWNDRAQSR